MLIEIGKKDLDLLTREAGSAPRKRKNRNYHKFAGDLLQRMLHASNTGTYVQPHKHENPDKREVFIVLQGSAAVVEFNDQGEILNAVCLDPVSGPFAAEIPERTWHTVVTLEDNTVLYEVKDGPYNPADDKNFASWAPREGDHGCIEYLEKIMEYIKASNG
jgi:cupin fold WbuC family metalloprotein